MNPRATAGARKRQAVTAPLRIGGRIHFTTHELPDGWLAPLNRSSTFAPLVSASPRSFPPVITRARAEMKRPFNDILAEKSMGIDHLFSAIACHFTGLWSSGAAGKHCFSRCARQSVLDDSGIVTKPPTPYDSHWKCVHHNERGGSISWKGAPGQAPALLTSVEIG